MMKQVLFVSLTFGLLGACQSPAAVQNQVNRAVQGLRASQTPAGAVRSNTGLDAVAKRMRFVGFQLADRDRNGQISVQEFPVYSPGMTIASFDKNKDGQLSFSEYDKAMQATQAYGMSRTQLRQFAQQMWNQINTDGNQILLRSEIEAYFTAPYDQLPMPITPHPLPSSVPVYTDPPGSGTGYGDAYGGGGYGSGSGSYSPPANWEQLKYAARKQAIDFFVQSDSNLDQRLSFSEYEDGFAKNLLSSTENALGNQYPSYYPYGG